MSKTLTSSFKLSALTLAMLFTLTACDGDDGENGAAGAQGPVGEQGPAGADGQNGTDGQDGTSGDIGQNGVDGADGSSGDRGVAQPAGLVRLATVPTGAEVTGAFVTADGDLFFNFQHPDDVNDEIDTDGKTHNRGGVGVVQGVNINKIPKNAISTPIPVSDEEKETVQVAYGEYKLLGQYGDTYEGNLVDGLGAIMGASGKQEPGSVAEGWPDFNGYIPTGANEGYLFTNWEYFPGGMSRMKISKDASSGEWSVDNTDVTMLDFGTYGTVANCFGSVTPWNTPLTSEEWGNNGDASWSWNDPADTDNASRDELAKFINSGITNATEATLFPNTYRYHYIVEITDPAGTATPVKRYALGRFEHENAVVMPDQKTVYLSQDSTNGVFYKFVADTAGDLSAGTLFAAKLTQDAGSTEPAVTGFNIVWIELASGDEATIEGWISEYDAIDTDSYVDGRSNYLTDADAIAWAAGDTTFGVANTQSAQAVTDGYEDAETYPSTVTAGQTMDDRVAFLESRKAARAKGATAEWRKFEGININTTRAQQLVEDADPATTAYVYFAIADIDRGMIDGEGDIRLSARVKDCGGVYRMALEDDYDVSRIEPVLMGAAERNVEGIEECDANGLSQPDNVVVMEDGRILIGEDGGQANNTLWMYNPSVND